MNKIFKAFCAAIAVLAISVICDNSAYANGISVYDGIDYSPVYDYDYYLANNPDLALHFSGSPDLALSHFVNFGMNEGRKSCANFDWHVYKLANLDLKKAFGNNVRLYYIHYATYGKNENRIINGSYTTIINPLTEKAGIDFSEIYDFEYYYSKHKDVAQVLGYDDEAVLRHFVNYGIFENRQAKEDVLPTDAKYIALREKYRPFLPREIKYPVAARLIKGGDLRRAFDISHSISYFGHNDQIPSDPIWTIEQFADFGFTNKKGNCYVMAAMFYEMAYVLGYNPRQMAGWVPSRTRGITQHSWVEIDMNGETWVFDPDFTYSTKKDGFMFKYGTKGTWKYTDYSPM